MHPGMYAWWKSRQECRGGGARAGWGHGDGDPYFAAPHSHDEGGGFGVRRPLRFLAYKLELTQEQVGELARVLAELKTERAQNSVDERRSTGALADALAGDTFDTARAREALDSRVKAAERLRDTVLAALGRIHALLTPEQRAKLAYLMRTGALSV